MGIRWSRGLVLCCVVAGLAWPQAASAAPFWSTATAIPGAGTLVSVSCPSSSFCAAVDDHNAFTYNGSSWTEASQPDSGQSLHDVSCASSSFCVAVDDGGQAFTYNGSAWSLSPINTSVILQAVSCPTTSFCAAVDIYGEEFTYNGTWTTSGTQVNGGASFSAVSCLASELCVAVDSSGGATKFTPTTHTAYSQFAALFERGDTVSCRSSTFCVATDSNGDAWAFDGNVWHKYTPPPSMPSLDPGNSFDGVSCVLSSPFCVAVDSAGNAWTLNSGAWSESSGVNSATLNGVSCPTSAFCVAVDEGGDYLIYRGAPANLSPPTITGQLVTGQTLTEVHGGWAGNPSSYSYQWYRCDSGGNNCSAISGATSQTYVPTSADAQHRLRVSESATNAAGSGGPVMSAATPAVFGLAIFSSGNTANVAVYCIGTALQSCWHIKVTITVTASGKLASASKGKHKLVIGMRVVTLPGGQGEIIPVPLNSKGMRLLSKHHKLKVQIAIAASGSGHLVVAANHPIVLKKSKKKHKH